MQNGLMKIFCGGVEMSRLRTRLAWLLAALLLVSMLAVSGCAATKTSPTTAPVPTQETKAEVYQRAQVISNSQDAIKLLQEGNQRYVAGKILGLDLSAARRNDLFTNGQKPFAVVLCCSDSRVPPELLFNQGLGDLFVVRVAGNIVDPVALGSIEYGAEHLGAPLVVVLGHSKCGAVKATVDGGEAPGSIGALVEKIKPISDKAKAAGVTGDALYTKVEDDNITSVMAEVEKSPIISHLLHAGKLQLVGAKYHIDSGEVVFNQAPAAH